MENIYDFTKKKELNAYYSSVDSALNERKSYWDTERKDLKRIYEKIKNINIKIDIIKKNLISLIRNNKAKTEKLIVECNIDEIEEEVTNLAGQIEEEDYSKMLNELRELRRLRKELEPLGEKMVGFSLVIENNPLPEDDFNNEVKISVAKKNQDDMLSNQVIAIKKASPELIKDLEKRLTTDNPYLDVVQDEISSITNFNEEDFTEFTITNEEATLANLTSSVYHTGAWYDLYMFGHNQDILDKIAMDNNMTIIELATSPGYLKNVTLEFPTIFPLRSENDFVDIMETRASRSRVA